MKLEAKYGAFKDNLKEGLKANRSNLPDSPKSELSDDEMFLVIKEAKEQRQFHKKKKAKTASEEQHEKYLHAEISVRGAKN